MAVRTRQVQAMLGNRYRRGLRFDAIHKPVGGRIETAPTHSGQQYVKLDNSAQMSPEVIEACTNCKRLRCTGSCDEIIAIEREHVDPKKRAAGKCGGYKPRPTLKYRGKMYCATELARMAGLSEQAFRHRIKNGWPVEKAVETPSRYANARKGDKP